MLVRLFVEDFLQSVHLLYRPVDTPCIHAQAILEGESERKVDV